MTDALKKALDEWHRADDGASEAERRFRAAWDAGFAEGAPVPEELVLEVHRRRSEANAKLRAAIALAEAQGARFDGGQP